MIKRRTLLALPGAVVVASGLQACGGGGSSKSGNVRLVNATSTDSVDLRVASANIITGVAKGAVSGYVSVGEGTTAFQIGQTGVVTTLLTQSNAVSNGVSFTMVAYNTNSTLNAAYFADNEAAPTSGTAKFRLFNSALEAGALDVYVIATAADPVGSTPINTNVAGQRVGGYSQVGAGTWRVVVTGNGDPTDVRLDIPSVTLADQQIATLVVTATDSGVLVNGLLLSQAGTVSAFAGSSVRLRVVANLTTNAPINVGVGGNTIFAATGSPSVTNYVTVPADLSTLTVTNATLTGLALTPAAGTDLTLLVYGTSAAPIVKLLVDDNKLPTSTSKAKIRLVNVMNGQSNTDSISMEADFSLVASSVTLGSSSAPAQLTPTATMALKVSAPSVTTPLWSQADVGLVANHVYTAFLLGATGAAQGVLRQDR